MTLWTDFKNLHYYWLIFIAAVIRLVFISYSIFHDANFEVPYTDVDYKVFTDASRHVLNGRSPYERHTYRYSPIIAIILIPNLLLHPCFGKALFSLFDLIVGLLIRAIVKHNINDYETYYKSSNTKSICKIGLDKPSLKHLRNRNKRGKFERSLKQFFVKQKKLDELVADVSMIIWLFNPLTVAIATRGNSDSIAGLLVLLTLYFLECKNSYFITGLIHGFSVHLRLYPIVYSLAMFMFLSKYSYPGNANAKHQEIKSKNLKKESTNKTNEKKIVKHEKSLKIYGNAGFENQRRTIFKMEYVLYLVPNMSQLKLIIGCLISLISLTSIFYSLYGHKFLQETYIYHLIRKDTRHNFSLFFYLQYLTADVKNIGLWQKVLISMPQLVLLLVFSVHYGLNKLHLNFALLTLTVTMVTYNTVLTSQYFVWILAILPLCLWQIRIPFRTTLLLTFLWIVAQGSWLIPAYLFEFRGQNTFLYIWIQSVSFFCANIAILGRLVMNFMKTGKKMKSH